jgi:hypothetical protein
MMAEKGAFRPTLNPNAPVFIPKALNSVDFPPWCMDLTRSNPDLEDDIFLPEDLFDSFDNFWEPTPQYEEPQGILVNKHMNRTEPIVSNGVNMLAFVTSMNQADFRSPKPQPTRQEIARTQNIKPQHMEPSSMNKFAKRRIQQPW